MLLTVLQSSFSDALSKVIFLFHPEIGVVQYAFARGLIQLVLLAILINKDVKYILYGCIDRKYIPSLIMRVFMGNLTFFLMTISLKYLPLLVTSIVVNSANLMTVLLGAMILGERITKAEMACLFVAFLGVYVLFSEKTSNKGRDQNIDTFHLLLLCLIPFLIAMQNVLLRHMRGFHQYTVASYITLGSVCVSGVGSLLSANSPALSE